jgi:hypothetical protein
MLASPAYRVLSLAAHRVLSRIEIELSFHAGKDNGSLIVTKEQFQEYGVHHHGVAPAIRELEALGFLRVVRGSGGNGGYRKPNLFRLTYLPTGLDGPTNEWAAVETVEDAEAVARAARADKADGYRPKRTRPADAALNGAAEASASAVSQCRKTRDAVPKTGTEKALPRCRKPAHRALENASAETRHNYLDIQPGSLPARHPEGALRPIARPPFRRRPLEEILGHPLGEVDGTAADSLDAA